MGTRKEDLVLLPRASVIDASFHKLLIDFIYGWNDLQRVVFKRYYYDSIGIRNIADEIRSPKITVRILLLYGKLDVLIFGIKACIAGREPPVLCSAEAFYSLLSREEEYINERLAEKRKDAVFAQLMERIAAIPSTGTARAAPGG